MKTHNIHPSTNTPPSALNTHMGRWILPLLILLTTALQQAQAQLPIWTFNNQQMDLTTTPPTLAPLPTNPPPITPQNNLPLFPGDYTGTLPQHGSNAWHGPDGNLLFFIIDDKIYDGEGYLIDRFFVRYRGSGSLHFPKAAGEFAIIPKPNSCDQFFIAFVALHRNGNSWLEPTGLYYFSLDMSQPNRHYPSKNGLVSTQQGVDEEYPVCDQLADSRAMFGVNGLGGGATKEENIGIAVTQIINSANHRYLFTSVGDVLIRNTILPDSIIVSTQVVIEHGGGGVGGQIGICETEVRTLANGNQLTAQGVNGGNQTIKPVIRLLEINSLGTVVDSIELSIFNATIDDEFMVRGLEFSLDGRYLYYTGVGNNLPNLGYIDLQQQSLTAQPLPNAGNNLGRYEQGCIEVGKEAGVDRLFIATATGLARLADPNNPASAFSPNYINVTNQLVPEQLFDGVEEKARYYPLPNQIDGEVYEYLQPSILASDDTICANELVQLSGLVNGQPGTGCIWTPPGATVGGNPCEITVMPTVTTTYTLSLTEQSGCVRTAEIEIFVEDSFTCCLIDAGITVDIGKGDRIPTPNITIQPGETYVIEGTLVIGPDDNVTFTDNRFEFGPEGRLLIEGGTLTLDNTVLTTTVCNLMWPGVDVYSTVEGITFPFNVEFYEGRLNLRNNSLIEHAHIAVDNEPANNPGPYIPGHVDAENSTLLNNHVGLNLFGSGLGSSSSYRIHQCTFLTDALMADNTRYPDGAMDAFVRMERVGAALFTANTFTNSLPGKADIFPASYPMPGYQLRGTGISTLDAQYTIQDFTGNTFSGLDFGIYHRSSLNTAALQEFAHLSFDNCAQGIALLGGNNVEINDCSFTGNHVFTGGRNTDVAQYGIAASGVHTLMVNHNQFHHLVIATSIHNSGDPTQGEVNYQGIDETFYESFLEENDFSECLVGFQSNEENPRLELNCNAFFGDPQTQYYHWQHRGRLAYQGDCEGDPSDVTGNVFESTPALSSTGADAYFHHSSNGFTYRHAFDDAGTAYTPADFALEAEDYGAAPLPANEQRVDYCVDASGEEVLFIANTTCSSTPGFYSAFPDGFDDVVEQLETPGNTEETTEALLNQLARFTGLEERTEAYREQLEDMLPSTAAGWMLVPEYIQQGEYLLAQSTLSALPATHSGEQAAKALYQLQIDLGLSERSWVMLTPAEWALLQAIAQAPGFAAHNAQAVLSRHTGSRYFFPELMEPPIAGKSAGVEAETQLKVYPNPTSLSFTLVPPVVEKESTMLVRIMDAMGRIVWVKTLPQIQTLVEPMLESGVYLIEVQTAQGQQTQSLIIQ